MYLFLLFLFVHPFHVSVCELVYNEEDRAIQISYRIFLDDLELALRNDSGNEKLNVVTDSLQVHEANRDYFHKTFGLKLNSEAIRYNYIGGEIEEEVMWCYLEVENVDTIETLEVSNSHLTDIYDDQQNIIHFKIREDKQSFILRKYETTAVYEP